MCLIIFAHRVHPDYPLLLAANRDEFFSRPTAASSYWPEHPQLLAGRDLEAGGTWMGVTRDGRFAAVTNFRDPQPRTAAPRSRGELPLAFLTGSQDAATTLATIKDRADQYAGFNLLLGDSDGLWYFSNAEGGAPRSLAPGIYGLSNASLDTPWPKVELGKARMQGLTTGPVTHDQLLATVSDERLADPARLHPLGLRETMDRQLSAQFIRAGNYGTRASTTLWRDAAGAGSWRELSFDASGQQIAAVTQALPAAAEE